MAADQIISAEKRTYTYSVSFAVNVVFLCNLNDSTHVTNMSIHTLTYSNIQTSSSAPVEVVRHKLSALFIIAPLELSCKLENTFVQCKG